MKMTQYLKWKSDSSKGEVFTPIELVCKILDKIPEGVWKNPNATFLDPCMGKGTFLLEIVRRLVYIYGYTEDDAKSRVYGYDVRVKYISHLTRRGLKNVRHKDFLNEIINMKFDVVLGNPPFQSGKGETGGRTAIWRYFVRKGFSLLKPNGIISFVTPQFPNASKDLGALFIQNQTLWVDTDVKKYFKEGSTFFTWALKNAKKTTKTHFINEKIYLDITNKQLPKIVNTVAMEILNKIENFPKIEILFSYGVNHNKLKKTTTTQSPILTETHIYKLRRTVNDTFYSFTTILPTYYNDNKITFTKSGKPNFKYHDGNIDPTGAIKHLSGIILCENEEIANKMIWVFENSILSKFYSKCLNTGGMNGFNFIRPVLNYENEIDDNTIFNHYGLTEEQINFIKDNV